MRHLAPDSLVSVAPYTLCQLALDARELRFILLILIIVHTTGRQMPNNFFFVSETFLQLEQDARCFNLFVNIINLLYYEII